MLPRNMDECHCHLNGVCEEKGCRIKGDPIFLNDKTPLCGGGKRWEKSIKEKNIACDSCVLDRPVTILTVDSASLFISFLQS